MIILKGEEFSWALMPAVWVYTQKPAQRDKTGNKRTQRIFLKILKGETKSFFKN